MISIIVTHKNCLWYLEDCLSSIAAQTYKDFETVLIIDDLQDDKTEFEQLLYKYKESAKIREFYLEGKTGASAARNMGIKKAEGEYIYFLDNDDYLYGQALEPLAKLLDSSPDMAYGVFQPTWFSSNSFEPVEDYEETKKGLEELDFEDLFSFRFERYGKLENITVLGALYKKSLFTDNNIWFNEEQPFYADAKVVVQLLNQVKAFRCTRDSMYVKRSHNDKELNPSISQHTLDETMPYYFIAYEKCLEAAKGNERMTKRLHYILARFLVRIYPNKIRWGEDENWRTEYFSKLSSLAKDIKAEDMDKMKKRRNRNFVKAVAGGDFEKVARKGKYLLATRKIKTIIKQKRQRYKTITLYFFNKMKLKENWIVFESFMGRSCAGQPKYIYLYLLEHYKDKYKFIWAVEDKHIKIPGNPKVIKRFSLRYYYYMNRAKYWVNNMRQPLTIPRRPETIMLATWHGTPLKRLVFDMKDILGGGRKYKSVVYRQTRGWDYLLSDNPFSTEKFQSCFLFEKEKILEYGYPANDPMYAPDREERAEKIKKQLGIPLDKKVILYAPTWRDDDYYEIGQFKFNLQLDVNRLEKELGDEYVLILRLHYWVVERLDKSMYNPKFAIDASSYDDITDLYLVSDILITDYSSVFFDFANLKRPMLFYTYDLEKYRDVLHGFYLDMEKDLPGPMLLTNDDVIDAIKNIDRIQEQYKEKYEEFYNRFCCFDDGHAAQRVVEKVFK
ncbi:MAG: CDP-glycerol:glycerophosphate glycerophosphotransferase [Eubacterium sp.]